MPETVTRKFTLVLMHEGVLKQFESELRRTGYHHHFVIWANREELIFVPDKNRHYYLLGPAGHQRLQDGSLQWQIKCKLEELFGAP